MSTVESRNNAIVRLSNVFRRKLPVRIEMRMTLFKPQFICVTFYFDNGECVTSGGYIDEDNVNWHPLAGMAEPHHIRERIRDLRRLGIPPVLASTLVLDMLDRVDAERN